MRKYSGLHCTILYYCTKFSGTRQKWRRIKRQLVVTEMLDTPHRKEKTLGREWNTCNTFRIFYCYIVWAFCFERTTKKETNEKHAAFLFATEYHRWKPSRPCWWYLLDGESWIRSCFPDHVRNWQVFQAFNCKWWLLLLRDARTQTNAINLSMYESINMYFLHRHDSVHNYFSHTVVSRVWNNFLSLRTLQTHIAIILVLSVINEALLFLMDFIIIQL